MQLDVHTAGCANSDEPRPIHEKPRVVDPTGCATRHPLGKLDGQQPREQGVRDRVNDEEAPRPKNPASFLYNTVGIVDVFEDLTGAYHVDRSIRDWGRPHICLKGAYAV